VEFFQGKLVDDIACGSHCAFVKTEGTYYGFGINGDGQLGLGNTTKKTQPKLRNQEEGKSLLDVLPILPRCCATKRTKIRSLADYWK
jgi:alpha-tubulin suppressor-like RCC1 family protein